MVPGVDDGAEENFRHGRHAEVGGTAVSVLYARRKWHVLTSQALYPRPLKAHNLVLREDRAGDNTSAYIITTSYQKLPFGSGDDPDKLLFHQALN